MNLTEKPISLQWEKLRPMVESIRFPEGSNERFEAQSADGYAFLGAARNMLGLDSEECLEAMRDRHFTLNAAQTIWKTQVPVPASAMYVYTMWTCMELLRLVDEPDSRSHLAEVTARIGTYESGYVRYVDTDILYEVPNVTAAAGLIFTLSGNYPDQAKSAVATLRVKQAEGNWSYFDRKLGEPYRTEDIFHLAMMIYQLRETERMGGPKTADIVACAVAAIRRMTDEEPVSKWDSAMGYGPAMVHLAVIGYDDDLAGRCLELALDADLLTHSNFRVRGLAAWALTKARHFDISYYSL